MLSAREVRGAICLVALVTTSVTVACGSTVPASRFASSSENTPQAQGAPGGHGLSAPESPAASGASSAPGQSPPAAVGAGSGAEGTTPAGGLVKTSFGGGGDGATGGVTTAGGGTMPGTSIRRVAPERFFTYTYWFDARGVLTALEAGSGGC